MNINRADKQVKGRPNQPITAPTSNWRGRGKRKFCIFKKPFVVIDS